MIRAGRLRAGARVWHTVSSPQVPPGGVVGKSVSFMHLVEGFSSNVRQVSPADRGDEI